MEVITCTNLSELPCGKVTDVESVTSHAHEAKMEQQQQPYHHQVVPDDNDHQDQPAAPTGMANPQDLSLYDKEFSNRNMEIRQAPSTAIVTPQKKMMTTSNDFHYISVTASSPSLSERKDGSSGGGSGNTNPNQASTSGVATKGESSLSSFNDMWQRYSGHLTPSLQTLEEGKQIIQRFFDGDACGDANCDNSEAARAPQQVVAPIQISSDDSNDDELHGSAPSGKNARRPGTENMDPQRSRAAGTVGGAVGSRRQTSPLVKKDVAGAVLGATNRRGSPTSQQQEHIEVNSTNEVRVIKPMASPDRASQKASKNAPVETLEVRVEDAYELERSISELTMRSSYGGGESMVNIPDNRRMAYYAVGKNHRQSGRGGNRRCYFSGKLILGGAPFYAGAVQQGLRTLVVFCLPSALNLPDRDSVLKAAAGSGRRPSNNGSLAGSGHNGILLRDGRGNRSLASRSIASRSVNKSRRSLRAMLGNNSLNNANNDGTNSIASNSRMTSLDDLSLSIDGDLDPNWGMDRDLLLQVLPEADKKLLDTMSKLFPEQFETLPLQVRDGGKWKLYVKFCFFSGLPIAEGEMHYKVLDELAEQVYGEEIVLSHDVMEAVNGNVSAEILQLPNQKLFRYLRKHYAQQCSKLDDRVFRRSAWLRVAPEV